MREGRAAGAGMAARAFPRLRRNRFALTGGLLLVALYAAAALAPFLAPYGAADLDTQRYLHPPMRVYWRAPGGAWPVRPYVCPTRVLDVHELRYAEERAAALPLRFFVHGTRYRLLGVLPSDRHLFGVDAPGRVHLLGTDQRGRDEWSLLLLGSQVSLTVGLVGILISFSIGLLLGGLAGYLGGWVDALLMRSTEVLLSVPALYLVIALRAGLPATLASGQVYLLIVVILAFVGWAVIARVIRGMVLGIRRADYVVAAEALGMSRWRVLVRHILPSTTSYVIVAATVAVPGYILGEVFLSLLGMGVDTSWGNMLQQATTTDVMSHHPWVLFVPAGAIFVTVLAFNLLGDGLRDALDPRALPGGSR